MLFYINCKDIRVAFCTDKTETKHFDVINVNIS